MLLKKTYFIFLFLIVTQIFYGQEYGLFLTEGEKKQLNERVVEQQNNPVTINFVKKALEANILKSEIDSLLIAKETFLYLKERIDSNSKLRDSLFLLSENNAKLKTQNFHTYRKNLATILSQEQFYKLYKEIIDSKSNLAVEYKLSQLLKEHKLNEIVIKDLYELLQPLMVDICLAEDYYVYDKKLSQYKKHLLEKHLAVKVEEKIKSLGLQNENNIFDTTNPKISSFIKQARSTNINDSLIVEIVNRIEGLNKQLENSKKLQGVRNPNYLYIPYSAGIDSTNTYQNFENYITSVLTKNQYKKLFLEQFTPEIAQMSHQKFNQLNTTYKLDNLKNKDKQLLQKWVNKYSTDEFITDRYYSYESSLAKVKVKRIRTEADKNLRQIIFEITKKPIATLNLTPRVKKFLENAEERGIDSDKAQKIAEACLEYELKQEEIMALKKYDKRFVYSLDSDGDKINTRNSFRYFLTQELKKTEYQHLFWEQLEPEINTLLKLRLKKVKETYPKIKGGDLEDLRQMLHNQVTKETVAKYYYSYDKKIAKQKVNALNYKFNKEYIEKVKPYTQ